MRVGRRVAVSTAGAALLVFGLQSTAVADPTSCFVSNTSVPQGGSITVSGEGNTALEALRAILDGTTQVGGGNAGTGTPITYSFTVTIPASATAGVTHTLAVQDGSAPPDSVACPSILVTAAAAATPTPTPAPDEEDEHEEILEAIEDLEPQQQQQQQIIPVVGGFDGGVALVGQQQQQQRGQQQQQQTAPVVKASPPAPVLPKTGANVIDFGRVGTAFLAMGGSLTLMSHGLRRRVMSAPPGVARFLPRIEGLPDEDILWWRGGAPVR